MPQVPGYTPAVPPKPNLKELARLRKVVAERLQEELETKLTELRDKHWLDNPMPEFDVPRRHKR